MVPRGLQCARAMSREKAKSYVSCIYVHLQFLYAYTGMYMCIIVLHEERDREMERYSIGRPSSGDPGSRCNWPCIDHEVVGGQCFMNTLVDVRVKTCAQVHLYSYTNIYLGIVTQIYI